MKNRIASLFLVFALLMSLCVNAVARDNPITVQSGGAERFTDVPTSHWAYGYINKVVGSGLFNGKTPTTFEPSSAMTRSQFVLVMARMEGRKDLEGVETQTIFPDVAPTRLAAGPIQWANEQGFVLGFGDGTFKPDSPITRGQFAALIHRYITAKGYTNLNVVDPEPAQFTDAASVSAAFTADVEYARIHGLLTGYSDGTVRSGNPITRAAIAAILARFLDLVGESTDPATGKNYVPLLDYPRDTGNSGTTPITTPTSYDEVKMTVNGGTHGATPTVGITRNGAAVAADDVKPGDRVTISHKPEPGYVAVVRVRDANNKTVSVNRVDSDTSWFYMPNAMPVTVTVTYEKESSGSSGGGGGGSSSSSGSTTGSPYYLKVSSTVTPDAGGWTYVSKSNPNASNYKVPATRKTEDTFSSSSASVPGYAVFVANEDYTLKSVTEDPDTDITDKVTTKAVKDTDGNDVTISFVALTRRGNTSKANPTAVSVTGAFEYVGGAEDKPIDWTIDVNVDSEQAFYKLEENKPTAAVAELTANGAEKLERKNTANPDSAYLYVTPKAGYKFSTDSYVPDAGSATVKDVTPAGTDKAKVRVYEITRNDLQKGSNSTTVKVVLISEDPLKNEVYNVTVKGVVSTDGESTANTREFGADDVVTYEPFATPLTVQMGDTVTVTAPQSTGYVKTADGEDAYLYQILDVLYKYEGGEDKSLGGDDTLASPITRDFEINNDANVEVTVVYKQVKDEDLTYNVKADFTGKGSMVLNIGGKDYPVSDTNNTIPEITMSHVEYLEKYAHLENLTAVSPDENFKLPIYVTSTPIAADGYQYNSVEKAEIFDSASLASGSATPAPEELDTDKYYLVAPSDEYTVSAKFDAMNAYTYNLTIIGQGSVPITFNGDPITPAPSNNSDLPQTFTKSVSLLSTTCSLNIGKVAPSGELVCEDEDITVTASVGSINNVTPKAAGTNVTITADTATHAGTVDIVVDFHKADRKAFSFTVTSGKNGRVAVKSESGIIADSEANLEAKTASTNTTVDGDSNTATRTYWAYEDAIITLTPTPASDSYKTVSLTVTGGKDEDILPADGFSFKLTENGLLATATFGTFAKEDAYSVLLQAPFDGSPDKNYDMHSQSVSVSTDVDLQGLLNSMNNGQRNANSNADSNGIINSFNATPENLAKAFDYYFNLAKSKDKDTGEMLTGRESFKNMLEKSVAGSLEANLPIIIEKQKAAMLAEKDANGNNKIEEQLKDTLSTALSNVNATQTATLADDNSTKIDIVKQIIAADTDKKLSGLTVKDFDVTLTVNPLLTEDSGDAKSLLTQLQSQILAYLSEVNLDASYKDNLPTPTVNVDVKGYKADGTRDTTVVDATPTEITISASARFTALPKLERYFEKYLDQLAIWVNAQITVKATVDGREETLDIPNTVKTLYLVNDLGGDTLQKVKEPIERALMGDDGVDPKLAATWTDKLNELLDNGNMDVDMGAVLTKDILDQVVQDNLLGDTASDMFDKVASLGDHTNTTNAFMNLYRDFVVFDDTDGLKISLQTPDTATDPSKITTIGEVKDKKLVITLNFNDILRDAQTPTDKTSYERLVELIVALRDGMSADIKATNDNQTAQSVLASLIEGQINRNKGSFTAVKWGKPLTKSDIRNNKATVKELSGLVAELIMTPLDSDISSVWKKFEAKGYRNVQFEFNLSRGRVEALVKSLNYAVSGETDYNKLPSTISIGFRMAQIIDGADGFES